MSAAVPFLVENLATRGLAGSIGFDPLGLSNGPLPIEWMQEAEIKHGRVCMLAVLGMLVPEVITLPGREFSAIAAHDAGVTSGAMSQMLLWIGILETVALIGTMQMLNGSGRKPGDFGFDPLNFGTGKDAVRLQVAEIKNGRLAMLAFSGMITGAALSGNGFPFIYS
ncbi:chlorophyll a/b-binding protein domain-containing protein [Pavlovales sp. CCMP2436]|nr:chlorophyll a/b-binding protein domain-containing protein [Pavlovales sp. CCMP2436]